MHLWGEEGDVWKTSENGVGSLGRAEEGDEDNISFMDAVIF